MSRLQEADARAVLGTDVLGIAEVERVFGAVTAPPLPYTAAELRDAREAGELLVLRVDRAGDGAPLTIVEMIRRFPEAFDSRSRRQVGYLLKDEWGIELEPLAAADTCTTGWALVQREILAATRNLPYDDQDDGIRSYAARLGESGASVRRRTAVEAVYDLLLCFGARRTRLLEQTWDWSSSRTQDGGYLNVGGFSARGMQIFGYSKAIRHGALGVCPNRQRAA